MSHIKPNELSDAIKYSDKDLFKKFRDKEFTLDQLKSRVSERRFGLKYTVIDDLKGILTAEQIAKSNDPKA